MPLYTVRESAQIISPLNFSASSMAKADLPEAVSPTITTKGATVAPQHQPLSPY